MTVYLSAHSRFWQYDFQVRKKRYHGSTGVETKRKAEAYERHLREQIAEGIDPNDSETLDYFAGRYWAEVGQHRASARQLKHRLAIMLRLLGKDSRLIDIGTKETNRAIEIRRGETYARGKDRPASQGRSAFKAQRYPVGPATVNSDIIKPLRAIWTRARDTWGVKGLKPIEWSKLALAEPKTAMVHFADDYQVKWLAACGPTERFALQLLLTYGLRFGGLFFRPEQFLAQTPSGPGLAIIRRKGRGKGMGEPIFIPLREDDARQIAARLGQAVAAGLDSIWIERGSPDETGAAPLVTVTYGALQSRIRKAAERAGVDHKRLIHAVRHHVGTDLLHATGDIRMVQKALGHADIKSTLVYAHALDSGLRAALESRNTPGAETGDTGFSLSDQPTKGRRAKEA